MTDVPTESPPDRPPPAVADVGPDPDAVQELQPADPDVGQELLPDQPGFVARKIAWGKETAENILNWLLGARETHASVDVGFRAADRDRRVAAGVLAGGVAYRYFFWVLALTILTGGTFGFIDGQRVEDVLTSQGVDPTLASTLAGGSPEGYARWWLIILGTWLVLWTGYLGAKALVLVHAVVWGMTPPPVTSRWRASVAFTGTTLVLVFAMSGVRWLREQDPILGLLVTAAVIVVPFGIWLAASMWLPHADANLMQLVPGAAVVAVGFEALHIFTIIFIGPKLASATELYGAIGIVGTILLWLYFLGRLVIGGATLNASLHERGDLTIPSVSLKMFGPRKPGGG